MPFRLWRLPFSSSNDVIVHTPIKRLFYEGLQVFYSCTGRFRPSSLSLVLSLIRNKFGHWRINQLPKVSCINMLYHLRLLRLNLFVILFICWSAYSSFYKGVRYLCVSWLDVNYQICVFSSWPMITTVWQLRHRVKPVHVRRSELHRYPSVAIYM